jgi:hypothetical protein
MQAVVWGAGVIEYGEGTWSECNTPSWDASFTHDALGHF